MSIMSKQLPMKDGLISYTLVRKARLMKVKPINRNQLYIEKDYIFSPTYDSGCAFQTVIELIRNYMPIKHAIDNRLQNRKQGQIVCELIAELNSNKKLRVKQFQIKLNQFTTNESVDNKTIFAIGKPHDPLKVIEKIQELLFKGNPKNVKLPLIMKKCKCSKGKFQYSHENICVFTEFNNNRIQQIVCDICKTNQKYKIAQTPNKLIIALKNNDQAVKDKRRLFYSILHTHHIKAIIQYTTTPSGGGHFRIIYRDFEKRSVSILDNGNLVLIKLKDWKKEVLNQKYTNYIFALESKNPKKNWYMCPRPDVIKIKIAKDDYLKGKGSEVNHANQINPLPNLLPPICNEEKKWAKKQKQTTKRLNLLCWNVQRGMGGKDKLRKKTMIKSLKPDIGAIIEPQDKFILQGFQIEHSLPYTEVQRKLNACLVINKNLTYKKLSSKINYVSVIINKDYLRDQTLVIALYLNPSLQQKFQDLNELTLNYALQEIDQFQSKNPTNTGNIILMGDLNLTPKEMQNQTHPVFNRLSRWKRTDNKQGTTKNKNRQIDFIFSSKSQLLKSDLDIESLPQLSDHIPILSHIIITETKLSPVRIPNREFAQAFTNQILNNRQISLFNLHQEREKFAKESNIPIDLLISPDLNLGKQPFVDKLLQLNEASYDEIAKIRYDKFVYKLNNQRFSQTSRQAFDSMKRATKYHEYMKREGGLMVNARAQDGTLVEGQTLHKLVADHYRLVHNEVQDGLNEKILFPKLFSSQPTLQQIMKYSKNVSQHKALVYDGIDDNLFNWNCSCKINNCQLCQRRYEILCTFLKPQYWSSQASKVHLSARLITLNKKFPSIPAPTDYRPIVAMSPVIKFIEGVLMQKLRKFAIETLDRRQMGFCPDSGIDQCKFKLFSHLNNLKRNKKLARHVCLFVDFSSAYDRIDRRHLYTQLRILNVLTANQIQLLQFLQQNLRICIGSMEIYTTNGVMQGMTTSPMLFDIITHNLFPQMNDTNNNPYFILMYADDLVCVLPNRSAARAISLIQSWSKTENMVINYKKSGLMVFGKRPPKVDPKYPTIEYYNYLGLTFSKRFNIDEHMKRISRKASYITLKLKPILLRNNFKLNVNLYSTLIMPLYRLANPIYNFLSIHKKQAFDLHIRNTAKKFLMLPNSTSTSIITYLIGNFEAINISSRGQWQEKIQARDKFKLPDVELLKTMKLKKQWTKLPNIALKVIQVCYSCNCNEHKSDIFNTKHLTITHNFPAGPLELLKRAQKYENSAKSDLKRILEQVTQLKVQK